MLPGLYSAATSLNAAVKNQEVIARNLAHVDVPGFRRSVPIFETFQNSLKEEEQRSGMSPNLGTHFGEVMTDFSEGAHQHTGRPLDVAISGDGFFEVKGPDGPLYTRNGVFQISPEGKLVTNEGLLVMGENGPISISEDISTSSIIIGTDGAVSSGGTSLGRIKTVAFEDNQQLISVGTTLFEAPPEVKPTAADVRLQQGSREMSNVQAVDELVLMIVGLRYHEMSEKAMDTIASSVAHNTNPRGG